MVLFFDAPALSAEQIADETAAIAAVKAEFFLLRSKPIPEARKDESWHARLRGDTWQVWLGLDYGADAELPCLPFSVYYVSKNGGDARQTLCIPEPPGPPPPPPPPGNPN
jgi:hypothetical protein